MDEPREGDSALPPPKSDHCRGNEDGDNIDVTSCSSISQAASASSSGLNQNLHANLWNKFLRTISQQHQHHQTERKYPNPDVPEFYPRNTTTTSYFNACAGSSDQTTNGTTSTSTTTTKCIAYNTNNLAPKKDLVLMSQQCFAAATTSSTDSNPTRDVVHGVTQYYWTFGEPCPDRLPRVLAYKSDRLEIDRTIKPPSSDQHFRSELVKKDKQLLHLNNVVKALLEEIWRVNELLIQHKSKEQLKNDITFAIDGLLKPSSELGFHCDDCCDKFKQFVVKLFKQQERKFAKQQAHYKDMFIEYLVSIIGNSLEAFSESGQIKYRFNTTLAKHDAATQTELLGHDDQRKPYRRPDTRRSKHQMTKIYRNRNFYKDVLGNAALDASAWYPAPMPPPTASFVGRGHGHHGHNERNRNKLFKQHFQPCAYSYSSQMYKTTTSTSSAAVQQQQASLWDSQATNPIQLIHQKYKNLNCRLEGIPDKNLVKFSYIVNGKEYSAIAATKKEAQYHCAWHVLGATKQK